MTGADLSYAVVEMSPAQIRAAKIDSNRRALAAMLHHHGDRAPEAGCSVEALRIRQVLFDRERARQAEAAQEEPGDALALGIDRILGEVASQHGVTRDQLLNPVHRTARRSEERRAQLANQEAMYRAYHEVCCSFRVLGRHFDKDHTTIRKAVRGHTARIGTCEGAS